MQNRTISTTYAFVLLVACLCLGLSVYTYVGYPILVGLLARWFPTPWPVDRAWRPNVSVLIPVFNAESYVRAKLESLLRQTYPADKIEILLCSDGSTDSSLALARQFLNDDSTQEGVSRPKLRCLKLPRRSGKPTAVNLMRQAATGEVLVLTDIRQPLEPNAILELVANLKGEAVACVSGNLELKGATGAGFYWRYENWLRKKESQFRSMLGVTGPLYAIRRADLVDLPLDIVLDDMWVPMRLRLQGRRIVLAEQAVAYDDAFADEREFGRKVRTLAGNYQLLARLPKLLWPIGNPSWFEILSHKLLRLAGPWVLLGLFASSAWALGESVQAGGTWGMAARVEGSFSPLLALALVLGQLAFYALAALGPAASKLGVVARTFVVMNWAAVIGLARFLRGTQRITW